MAFAKPRETPADRKKRREKERQIALQKRKEDIEQQKKVNPIKTKEGRALNDWEIWEEKASNYVEFSFINTGFCNVPNSFLKSDGSETEMVDIPVLCTLLRHPVHGLIMVDLGLPDGTAGGLADAPAVLRKAVKGFNARLSEKGSAATQITHAKKINLEDIKTVIYTHYHWDHTGDFDRYPNADLVVGNGTMETVNGYLGKRFKGIIVSNFPEDKDRILEVKFSEELRVGPFRKTYDLFGDASIILIDCYGHTAGNMSVLVRTKKSGMILLAGDTVYCLDNYKGDKHIPKGIMPKLHPKMPKWARSFFRPDETENEANECVRKVHVFHDTFPMITIVPSHCNEAFQMIQENGWMFPKFIK